jgi:hypothetical protein
MTISPRITLSASHILPAVGKLRTAIEANRTPEPLAVRSFISQARRGHLRRLILNFCRPLKAAGGLASFLRVAFVNDCRQPANRIARTLSFTPVSVLSCALVHADNKSMERVARCAEKPSISYRSLK